MDRKLLVLGCSQTKRDSLGMLPAIERYDGSPYRVLRKFLRDSEWPSDLSVAILSAKYGLVGGFTGITDYNQRMTPSKASELAPTCHTTLTNWAKSHTSFHFSLGRDYLPAVEETIKQFPTGRAEVFQGPIGMKLNQIKGLLENMSAPVRRQPQLPQPGSGSVNYFLPDWDDLLDDEFDFRTDKFSGRTPAERNDKHCCVLMKPERMCDGVLVSLAQHFNSKGPLKRFRDTDSLSLAPLNMRSRFGLENGQSLFGDCGAFSYVNDVMPAISVEQAVSLYSLHGFDFGASVDHIPAPVITHEGKKQVLSQSDRRNRIAITQDNAAEFISLVQKRKAPFVPIGVIQALTPAEYAKSAQLYHEMGYRHLALGGLVPLSDEVIEEIVIKVMNAVNKLNPRPWIHLFGIYRPKLQAKFRNLKIDSFDSASYFRKAWLRSDQNYLGTNGKWYAALRVPMTSDGRTRKRLEQSGVPIPMLEEQEKIVMSLLCRFDLDRVNSAEVLDALLEYDSRLVRSSDYRSLRTKYERTLNERPWRFCDCPICKQSGIHVAIFRGANRNKRRGAHNTLMLYNSLRSNFA